MKHYKIFMKKAKVKAFKGYVRAESEEDACKTSLDDVDAYWESCAEWPEVTIEAVEITKDKWDRYTAMADKNDGLFIDDEDHQDEYKEDEE